MDSVNAATAADADTTTGSGVEETRNTALSSTLAAQEPVVENDTPPASQPDPDSVAAKLQRIRAVVGKYSQKDPAPADDAPIAAAAEVEQSDDPVAELDAHEAELAAGTLEGVADQDDAPDGTDMISRVMARHSDAASETTPEVAEADPVEAEAPKAEQPRARIVRMKRADLEKATNATAAQPASPDFGLLDGADELDDYLEDSDFTDGGLNAEEDSALLDSLKDIENDAAVEAPQTPDMQVDVEEDVAIIEGPDEATVEQPNRAFLNEDPQLDDENLDRLLSETDVQMQEPEGSRRRDAIAQLKAAVAAKEAARQVGEPEDDGQDVENAFRDDLSAAVRPEGTGAARPRPVVRSASTRTERPRPAPLKLVAAQRVNLGEAEKRDGPVVPRRVAAQTGEERARSAGSFAEFADTMGAKELPDLLEAAAAYTAFVEGADEFSRPQILRRVRAVSSDDFKREDGLRSFADLLEQGRFTKVRNGRFQVADDSRFNPERRAG